MTKPIRGVVVSLALAALGGALGCGRFGGSATPSSEDEKALYAVGLMLGRNASIFNLTPHELEIVKAGFTDAILKHKPLVDLEKYGPKVNALAQARQTAGVAKEKESSKQALEAAAREPGAVKTPSGLVIRTVKEGNGETPKPEDRVKVHYEGKLLDGSEFDSSRKRGQPATFPLNGVIKCWSEGVGRMKVGEQAVLTCPSDIAYGDGGRPPQIPGGATLVFNVELLAIEKPNPPPPPAAPTMSQPPPPSPHGPPPPSPHGPPPPSPHK
jgi:FKBP-type peptidyl-prolyl cis-trans isomerase FkpA